MTPSLSPGTLRSAVDLFAKVRRDAELLMQEVTSDRVFNFTVTAYSLIDWIRNDPAVPERAKQQSEIEKLRSDPWLKLCGDLATSAKHFELTTRKPTASEVTAQQGYGMGRFGKGGWGVGEEQITIHLPDGSAHDVLELVEGSQRTWGSFFALHGITI